MQYAGTLRVLADKAYPNWTADQRGEVLRNHFIQGVSSPSVQLRLKREIPATLDAALTLAVQQQSVKTAQQRLYKEIHCGGAAAMALQQRGEKEGTESDPAAASNAMSRERACGTFDPRLDELSKDLRRLSSELAQLRSDQSRGELQRRQGQREKVCQHAGSVASMVIFVGTALTFRQKDAQEGVTGQSLQPITLH